MFLPASARPDAAVEQAATQAKVRGGKETILLVEDEVALRGLTKIILQRFGYRVVEAESGMAASYDAGTPVHGVCGAGVNASCPAGAALVGSRGRADGRPRRRRDRAMNKYVIERTVPGAFQVNVRVSK